MTPQVRDPVCGMAVDTEKGLAVTWHDRTFFLCSEYCKQAVLAAPDGYSGLRVAPVGERDRAARRIAYFAMEVGIDPRLPTYSGGLDRRQAPVQCRQCLGLQQLPLGAAGRGQRLSVKREA